MRLTIHTQLCTELGIQYPIFQAPMAGGITTPELVAAVSNAGGLGSLAGAYMTPDEIRVAIQQIRQMTDRPFSVNLFITNLQDDYSRLHEVNQALAPIENILGIQPPTNPIKTPNLVHEQVQVLLEEMVPVLSTTFGVLPEKELIEAHSKGIKVMTMVTTVQEALLAEEHGADFLIAQGSDAGGHRGTFDMNTYPDGSNIGTFSLVPQVVDAVKIPVIAAGGIMDGRGLIAALALGAQGASFGTRFMTTSESGAHPTYQQALVESTDESTVITKAFSGRPARGIINPFIQQFEQSGIEPLPFPSQNTRTKDIRKAAAQSNNPDYMSLWAGQATRLLTKGNSAKEVVEQIVQQALHLLS